MEMEPTARTSPESLPAGDAVLLNWSKWFRCESSFNLLLVPEHPGIFAVAEEVIAPGESGVSGGKRLLALLHFGEADNLARALSRLFTPASPLRERIAEGRCFLRYAVAEDATTRLAGCAALQHWLETSAEAVAQSAPRRKRSAAQPQPPPLPAGF